MAKIKEPASSTTRVGTTPVSVQPSAPSAVSAAVGKAMDDGFSKAASGLLSYKSSPLVSGAIKIFSDGILFPSNLTDPKDPRNDPKYLRLLAAVLGLDDLESYYHVLEGKKQEDYLAHKAELREKRWARIEEEKEEKKRQNKNGQAEDDDEGQEND